MYWASDGLVVWTLVIEKYLRLHIWRSFWRYFKNYAIDFQPVHIILYLASPGSWYVLENQENRVRNRKVFVFSTTIGFFSTSRFDAIVNSGVKLHYSSLIDIRKILSLWIYFILQILEPEYTTRNCCSNWCIKHTMWLNIFETISKMPCQE